MDEQYGQILLAKIECDPTFQVRQSWDPDRDPTLPALVQSLTGPERQIHPIVVVARATPTTFGRTYTLITGHRRLAAAQRAGWERILARILPPCDLTTLHERLRLLAIAIRENTEREPLAAEDRREALRRLKALYDAVYPRSRPPAAHAQDPAAAEPPAFARWAATATHIPTHTIRRDLRRLLIAPTSPPPARPPLAVSPDPAYDALQAALHAGEHAREALQTLTVSLMSPGHASLAPEQVTVLGQTLQDLQATLAMTRTAATVPTPRSLDAFALLLWESVPPVTGALWGLATSPQQDWDTVPSTVMNTIHTAMTALFAGWEHVAPRLPAPIPHSRKLGHPPLRLLAGGTSREGAS
jgi:hypothetical protein